MGGVKLGNVDLSNVKLKGRVSALPGKQAPRSNTSKDAVKKAIQTVTKTATNAAKADTKKVSKVTNNAASNVSKPQQYSSSRSPVGSKGSGVTKSSGARTSSSSSSRSSKISKKLKNRNYYKAGKFKGETWKATVQNDRTKQKPTLDFTKGFNQAAHDLKVVKSKINKEFNNVAKQITAIKRDSGTGELLKNSLTSQLNAYETTRKAFLTDIKNLYNKAITEYNSWQQAFYEALTESKLTNQGISTQVQQENISEDDNIGIEG